VLLVPPTVICDRELPGLGERSLAFGRGVTKFGVGSGCRTGFAVGKQGFAPGVEDVSSALKEALYCCPGIVQALGVDDRVGQDEGGVCGVDMVEICFGSSRNAAFAPAVPLLLMMGRGSLPLFCGDKTLTIMIRMATLAPIQASSFLSETATGLMPRLPLWCCREGFRRDPGPARSRMTLLREDRTTGAQKSASGRAARLAVATLALEGVRIRGACGPGCGARRGGLRASRWSPSRDSGRRRANR